jgi:hypothetical protein
MAAEVVLRDLLYFDFDKSASLFSQIESGLLKEITSGTESSKDQRNVRKYDLKLFKPEFGGVAAEKTSQLESRVLHHDLLDRIESYIFDNKLGIDISNAKIDPALSVEDIHGKMSRASCLRVTGWAAIEDHERIKNLAAKFNLIAAFIGRCSMQAIEQSEEYKILQKNLDEAKTQVKSEKDKNKRARAAAQIETLEKQFRSIIEQSTGLSTVPEWLVDGMGQFIDTFMPSRVILRICPFPSLASFQVLANLKKDCFLDGDFDNFIFAYGTRPTIKLTVLGLISSLPDKELCPFDPMAEFNTESEHQMPDEIAFEKGFRNLFTAFEGFNKFARYSRYPNVTVYPLAVYRTIKATERD